MEEIDARYRDLCVQLGNVKVKMKGLENQEAEIFRLISDLDREAEKIIQAQQAAPVQEKKSEA
jgi:hypothetical protein